MVCPPKLSVELFLLLYWNPLVCPGLWVDCVLSCDLVASDVDHLESSGSPSHRDVPNVDVFHCVK